MFEHYSEICGFDSRHLPWNFCQKLAQTPSSLLRNTANLLKAYVIHSTGFDGGECSSRQRITQTCDIEGIWLSLIWAHSSHASRSNNSSVLNFSHFKCINWSRNSLHLIPFGSALQICKWRYPIVNIIISWCKSPLSVTVARDYWSLFICKCLKCKVIQPIQWWHLYRTTIHRCSYT